MKLEELCVEIMNSYADTVPSTTSELMNFHLGVISLAKKLDKNNKEIDLLLLAWRTTLEEQKPEENLLETILSYIHFKEKKPVKKIKEFKADFDTNYGKISICFSKKD